MSGIAGIAHSDGRPIDRHLLLRMTGSLAFRGPDAQEVWFRESVGLGHAAHLIAGDATRGGGPDQLDDRLWITADVRLDAHEELIRSLQRGCRHNCESATDSQLLLYAYDAWGEGCVKHISGEFSFALWDRERQQLFCACDQFGIRQLYFACCGATFVCSNTLDCVRLHPEISGRLCDDAIADFLLFGMHQSETATSFEGIQRLPRGHFLSWSPAGISIKEYWRPPVSGQIRYKHRAEYVEHFRELLRRAVADRIRGAAAGVLLSGGLDSSAIAALCREERKRRGSLALHAFVTTSENSEDSDAKAALVVANALNIPLHRNCADRLAHFEGWDSQRWPEPLDDPLAFGLVQEFDQISRYVPVALSGEGSDNLMDFELWPHLRLLWEEGHLLQATLDVAEHAFARCCAPDGLRGPLRRVKGMLLNSDSSDEFPKWLNPDFALRLKLKARWDDRFRSVHANIHHAHPQAYASLFFPAWRYMFEREDPAFTKSAVEVRYPFLDIRVVAFLLAIPAMPWFFRKFILREAVRERIPEVIRRRPKVTLEKDPVQVAAKRGFPPSLAAENDVVELARFVDLNFAAGHWGDNSSLPVTNLRPWCLGLWLQRLAPVCAEPVQAFCDKV